MPPLTRWFIKTALIYFVLALITGLLLASQKVWNFFLPSAGLFPVYFHLLAEGWITLLIIGVVFWMFPKYSRELPRGSEKLGWTSYILLNAGLLLRAISEPASSIVNAPGTMWGILLIIAALLQWAGGMAFVANTWGRVKEK
jgi:hypothetical protein